MVETPKQYPGVVRGFHWVTVPCVIVVFCLGLVMTGLPLSSLKLTFFSWHKWLGVVIFGLVCVRLFWRLMLPAPSHAPADGVPAFIHVLSRLGHGGLYGLLLLLPLVGWLRSSTAGIEVKLFGVVSLPQLMGVNEGLSNQLALVHGWGGWLLLLLLIGHVGAVIVHHRVWQDPVLDKMRPSGFFVGLGVMGALIGGGLVLYATVISPPPALQKPAEPLAQTLPRQKTVAAPIGEGWVVDRALSKIEFAALQTGAESRGRFKDFEIEALRFSQQSPNDSEVRVAIDIASLAVGNQLVEQTLMSSGWFAASQHPKAVFAAKGFLPLEGGVYQLNGVLTIKGIAKPLSLKLKIEEKEEKQRGQRRLQAVGEASIRRSAYQIGEGEFAGGDVLADEVRILIDVTAIKAQ